MQPAETPSIQIRPTGAALGADVENVDMRHLSDEAFEAVRTALLENLVVRIRGTEIDDTSFIGLARRFGEVEPPEERTRTASMTVPGFPEMSIISNIVENGVAKGESGDGELRWHTDHGFMETPVALSMLLAREVPPIGGDTG
jgi:taurine dioxygenase